MNKLEDIRNAAKAATGQKVTAPEQAESDEYYQAFSAPVNTQLLYLRIHLKLPYNLMLRYDFLKRIIFDHDYQSVALIYPDQTITLHGRNLKGLVQALGSHSVEWLYPYVPPFMTLAPDHDENKEPVITDIEILDPQTNPFNPAKGK